MKLILASKSPRRIELLKQIHPDAVLMGEEEALIYPGKPVWDGFADEK